MERVSTLLPHERVTRQRTLVQIMVGIYLSGSVHLSRIASKVPSTVKLTSITRRLSCPKCSYTIIVYRGFP